MLIEQVEFCFKGNRNYVHGPDIYNEFADRVNRRYPLGRGSVKVVMHRLASRQSQMHIAAPGEEVVKPEAAYSEFTGQTLHGAVRAFLLETGAILGVHREYHEERIEKACTIADKTVTVVGAQEYSPAEVVVAMNKRLHNALMPLSGESWIVTRFDLLRPFRHDDAARLAVTLQQQLGTRFTRSAITVDGEAIGHIFFSAVPR